MYLIKSNNPPLDKFSIWDPLYSLATKNGVWKFLCHNFHEWKNIARMVGYCKKPSKKQSLSYNRVMTIAELVFNTNSEGFN